MREHELGGEKARERGRERARQTGGPEGERAGEKADGAKRVRELESSRIRGRRSLKRVGCGLCAQIMHVIYICSRCMYTACNII